MTCGLQNGKGTKDTTNGRERNQKDVKTITVVGSRDLPKSDQVGGSRFTEPFTASHVGRWDAGQATARQYLWTEVNKAGLN